MTLIRLSTLVLNAVSVDVGELASLVSLYWDEISEDDGMYSGCAVDGSGGLLESSDLMTGELEIDDDMDPDSAMAPPCAGIKLWVQPAGPWIIDSRLLELSI